MEAIPDGNYGERWNYIGGQLQRFRLVCRRDELGGTPLPESGVPTFRLADIKPIAYDEAAISFYAEFKRLREQKIIPSNVRFQVGLPSPCSVMIGHLKPVINAVEPFYEQRVMETLEHIAEIIPHDDVVIQWDLCFEMTGLEFDKGRFTDVWHRPYFSEDVLQGDYLSSLLRRSLS